MEWTSSSATVLGSSPPTSCQTPASESITVFDKDAACSQSWSSEQMEKVAKEFKEGVAVESMETSALDVTSECSECSNHTTKRDVQSDDGSMSCECWKLKKFKAGENQPIAVESSITDATMTTVTSTVTQEVMEGGCIVNPKEDVTEKMKQGKYM